LSRPKNRILVETMIHDQYFIHCDKIGTRK